MNNPFRRWHILEGKIVRVAAADAKPEAKAQAQFVCTGYEDEKQINQATEELSHPDHNWIVGEIRRTREWRWPWQAEVKTTSIGGGAVMLSEGTFYITSTLDTKGIVFEGFNRQTRILKHRQ